MFTSPNKAFNLGGLKLSYSIIPNLEIREKFLHQYARNSVTSPKVPGQIATTIAYEQCAEWLNQCESYIRKNLEITEKTIQADFPSWKMLDMESSYLPWIDISESQIDMHVIAQAMAEQAGVVVGIGDDYVQNADSFLRLNLGTSPVVIKEAMFRMTVTWNKINYLIVYSGEKMVNLFKKLFTKKISILAPCTGELIPLSSVSDDIFAQKIVGDGFALLPKENEIYAPTSGTILSVFSTKHAISFRTDNGLELLLHLGVDTVELNGKPFNIDVKAGQKVEAGSLIGKMDIDQIKAAGKSDEVMFVCTNMDKVKEISSVSVQEVKHGQEVGSITLA